LGYWTRGKGIGWARAMTKTESKPSLYHNGIDAAFIFFPLTSFISIHVALDQSP
jgi:hypothetical protein